MPNWLKALLPGARPKALPTDRAEQNVWVKARHREWQLAWHDLFDQDPALTAEGSHRDDPLPDDLMQDNRLIHEYSRATPETRRACLALLPLGAELFRRTEAFLSAAPQPLPEAEARARIPAIAALFEEIGPNEEVDFTQLTVIERWTQEGEAAMRRTNDITILLEGNLLASTPPEALPGQAASFFLSEPLYAAAGNFYTPGEWICAPLHGQTEDRLHTALYELWQGGWQLRLANDGIALARYVR